MTAVNAGPASATIDARLPWNRTGIRLQAGSRYELTATGLWVDKNYEAGPDGYVSPNLLMKLGEFRRRVPKAKWFALIGALDEDESTQFVIGSRMVYTPVRSGELTCFANDWRSKYDNNSGALTLSVNLLSQLTAAKA
jgi:hypothetical protein